MTTATPATTPDAAAPSQEGSFDIEAMMREAIMGSADQTDGAPPDEETAPDVSPADGAEETDGKETEESSPDPDSADDTDDDAQAELIKDPAALLKAHGEMKAKLKERSEKLKELEARLAEPEVPAISLEPTLRNPLSNVTSQKQLAEAEAWWQKELDWCLANLEGGERPAAAGKDAEEWTPAQVREHLNLARRVIGRELSARQKFLTEFAASAKRSAATYPFLQKEHPLFPEVEAFTDRVVKAAPDLSQTPDWLETVSDAFLGRMVRSGQYGASVGKDGKVSLVKLGSGKTAPVVVKKTPQTTPRATAPAGKADKATAQDAAIAAAFARGDIEEAHRLATQAAFSKAA